MLFLNRLFFITLPLLERLLSFAAVKSSARPTREQGVNAELICHFFSEARCPLFSSLVCHLFASSAPVIRKAVLFGPRSGRLFAGRRTASTLIVNHAVP
jgi:hypothetical protein